MKHAIWLVVFACLLVMSSAALAADQPAQKIDSKKLAAGKELAELLNSTQPQDNPMAPMIATLVQRANPDKNTDVEKLVNDAFNESEKSHADGIANSAAAVYANFFSEDELQDAIAFYKSSTGQKMAHSMPQLMQQVGVANGQIAMQSRKESIENVIAALKKKDLKVPPELNGLKGPS